MEVQMFKQKAFTLIELLVTLAVLGVIAAIALPAFGQFILSARASSDVSAITSSLSMARSEAVKRNRNVCVAATDWADGWNVIVDDDGNGDCETDETILRTFSAIGADAALTVTKDGGASGQVLYRGSGRADGVYRLEYSSDEDGDCIAGRDRVLTVAGAGRTQIEGGCSS